MEFFTSGEDKYSSVLVRIRDFELRYLLIQTAACIINETKAMPIIRGEKPRKGAAGTLAQFFDWELHSLVTLRTDAFINSLEIMAEFLYQFVVTDCKHRFHLLKKEHRKLIAQALSDFQDFKTKFCKQMQKNHRERYGSDTGFFKMDWRDHNEEFLAIHNSEKK